MQYTENYNLYKPVYGEPADVADLNHNADEIDELIHDNRTMIAPAFDTAKAYVTGDPVEYQGKLYVFTDDKAAGAWDSSKVEQTTAAEIGGGGASALADLTDVDVITPADGEILIYDSASGKWVNGEVESATSLEELTDTTITTPTTGEVLTYDDGEWVNAEIPAAEVSKEATGNPIELTDAADAPLVKCTTAITGSQDLHGYDKPWVGGAGANKWDEEWEQGAFDTTTGLPTSSSNRIRSKNPIYVMPSTTYYGLCANRLAIRVFYYDTNGNHIGNEQVNNTSFTTPNDVSYMLFMSSSAYGTTYNNDIAINYPSTVTTYAPYSNICPITAYTESTISVSYNNQWDETEVTTGYYINEYGVITANTHSKYSGLMPVKNSTYKLNFISGLVGINNVRVHGYDDSGVWLMQIAAIPSEGAGLKTYDVSITDSRIKQVRISLVSYFTDISFCQNIDHTATFSNSIYQGNADFVGGTVGANSDGEMWLVADLGDLTWTVGSTTQSGKVRFRTDDITDLIKPSGSSELGQIICEQYAVKTSTEVYNCIDGIAIEYVEGFAHRIWIYDERKATLTGAQFKTAMSGIKIAYRLATPTTETITSSSLPIKSLFGYNHIESSTGNMEVEYITKPYEPLIDATDISIEEHGKIIESIITNNLEPRMVASRNYTVGEFIISGDKAYRATANIASGATLTVGTNVESTTIEDEIGRSWHVYSTSEKVVGTWIDGSTLYEKSYHVSTVTSTYTTIDSNITCNNAKIRNCSMGTITVGGAYDNAQYVDGRISQYAFARVILNTGGLTVGMENPPSDPITDFDFTVQYTKSSS